MPQPKPKTALSSHCSAIRNNVLYTFSEKAFQSLSLRNGSKWETLPHGVGTNGAACVLAKQGTPEESLYIVGGSTNDGSKNPAGGFTGLQRWIFAEKKWEQIRLQNPVTYNLVNHGAAFLSSTQQIIVFAGTQYPTVDTPSATTYLINTINDETIALPADTPLLAPMVLQWGADGALIVGGDSENIGLSTYSPAQGWGELTVKLKSGIPAKGTAGASLIDGDDGSRMLLIYDMTMSPATVRETLVLKAGGKMAKRQNGANPASSSTQKQLTADNWPALNNTDAPSAPRSGTSLAYNGDMVVISGGNADEPLLMFDQRKNAWINAETVLDAEPDIKFSSESVSSSTPTSTPTVILPSVSAAPTSDEVPSFPSPTLHHNNGLTTVQLLFVILGSILGACILLASIFFFLKRRRVARTAEQKKRMSFQDRGASFMKEAGGSSPLGASFQRPAHRVTDSWQVMANTFGINGLNGGASPMLDNRRGDYSGDRSPFADPVGPTVQSRSPFADPVGPTVQAIGGQGVIVTPGQTPTPVVAPVYAFGKERGSGWSKYFSDQSAGLGSQKTVGLHHTNPFLHNAGPGVSAGGVRRGSDISMTSIGADSFSSGIPESINTEKPLWSPMDAHDGTARGNVASSLYADVNSTTMYDDRRDTQGSRLSGPPMGRFEGMDNLSWLNLRQN